MHSNTIDTLNGCTKREENTEIKISCSISFRRMAMEMRIKAAGRQRLSRDIMLLMLLLLPSQPSNRTLKTLSECSVLFLSTFTTVYDTVHDDDMYYETDAHTIRTQYVQLYT